MMPAPASTIEEYSHPMKSELTTASVVKLCGEGRRGEGQELGQCGVGAGRLEKTRGAFGAALRSTTWREGKHTPTPLGRGPLTPARP